MNKTENDLIDILKKIVMSATPALFSGLILTTIDDKRSLILYTVRQNKVQLLKAIQDLR